MNALKDSKCIGYFLTSPKPVSETAKDSLSWINWPYFTVGLVTRGYSDKDIQKIIGENLIRVLKETEN
ncbi:MAG: hypothetical protein DDT31_01416 [Syntrophomonadaceae bacterium]|nr:hypothetical protein [Bacillota bacterium]